MYAIVEINGQQFRVEEGQKLFVHHMPDAEAGKTVEFENVLLVDNGTITVGAPTVEGAKVTAEVVSYRVRPPQFLYIMILWLSAARPSPPLSPHPHRTCNMSHH